MMCLLRKVAATLAVAMGCLLQGGTLGARVVNSFEAALRRKGYTKGYIVAFDFSRDAYDEVGSGGRLCVTYP